MRATVTAVACLAVVLTAAPANANVTVRMNGSDDGANTTSDSLSITGEDGTGLSAIDDIAVTVGNRGDIAPNGTERTCDDFNSRLCFLTVESSRSPITAQGACQRDGSDSKVKCAYFRPGGSTAGFRGLQSWSGNIALRGGNTDRVRILQTTTFSFDWVWTIDYGAGNDVIDGANVLSVAEENTFDVVTIRGGPGSDLFMGTFDTRPIRIFAGDGDDLIRRPKGGTSMRIDGEAGDDSLHVTAGTTGVNGGPGNDSMNASQAIDTRAATFDGGSGIDTISYSRLFSDSPDAPAVTLRLDGSAPSTGADTITNFENATGTPNGDRIIGNDQPNKLVGNGGRADSLTGGGGDDILDVDDGSTGPPGPSSDDAVEGGAGADLILANDGARDLVSCGTSTHPETFTLPNSMVPMTINAPDSDRVTLDLNDVERDCEQVERQPVRERAAARIVRATAAGANLRIQLRCPAGVRGGCRGRAHAETAGTPRRRGARVSYAVPAGAGRTVVVPLPAAVRTTLARRGIAVARAVVAERASRTRHRTVVLRRR
jgi:Ca2+-binding RTX toxin-like protein